MRKNKKLIFAAALALIVLNAFLFLYEKPVEQTKNNELPSSNETVLQDEKATEPIKTLDEKDTPVYSIQEENQKTVEEKNKGKDKDKDIKALEAEQKAEEPGNADALSYSLSIMCDDVIKNLDSLKESKKSIIPENGIILSLSNAVFSEGESVFDVMLRELKKAEIHFEFEKTPIYNTAYIKGIGNLYEFDCGDCSGWMYKVNGISPTYGCSQYKLKNGDKIEFYYSCNYLEDKE